MHALRSLTTGQRRLLLALFACAMVLRIAIPEGWMPITDASGTRLTICTGMGPVETMADMAGMAGMSHHKAPIGHDQGDHPCTFAGLGLAAALPDLPPAPKLPVTIAVPTLIVLGVIAVGRGLAAPPPPATGPPALA
ncbi:hypothetical protein K7G81_02855 [Hephaestia sp. CMS5P-6]|nr:hypothetical protein [Hephaestia mangrovi]